MVARSIAISFCAFAGKPFRFFHPPPPTSQRSKISAKVAGKRAVKIAGETGVASIYGFAGDKTAGGTKTANGEDIRPTDMSAAHKSIPFGTRVRVTNLVNGLSAVVRINNRGPFTKGRIIDLTPTAAQAIGFSTEQGIAPVTLMVLKD